MNFFKKNIILTPADYSNTTINNAVLSLEQFSKEETIGTLKCNSLKNINSKILLGVMINNNLHKIEVEAQTSNVFCFSLPINFENCQKISCVMLARKNDSYKPIAWGSTETTKIFQANILSAIEDDLKDKNYNKEQTDINDEDKFIEDEDDEEKTYEDDDEDEYVEEKIYEEDDEDEYARDKEIEELIESEIKKDLCEDCIYKNNFYNASSASMEKDKLQDENKNIFEKGEEDNFFALVEGQVEELLEKYPLEDAITQIIPNSKFVRVDYNNDGTYYIFGVIYEENSEKPKYICYGIPSKFKDEPPAQIDGFYQWLPVDSNNPEQEGYFIMYQNAETGENIKIEVI